LENLKILIDQEIPEKEWRELIDCSTLATPYQTVDYFRFVNNGTDYVARAFAIEIDHKLVASCVVTLMKEPGIKGFFSRRGIIFGGPVFQESSPQVLDQLLIAIKKGIGNKVIYLEVRNFNDYSPYHSSFTKEGWAYSDYLNVRLNLVNLTIDKVLARYKYNRRREIKQSLSSGASYRESQSDKEVNEVYSILKSLYKERVKLPMPSYEYFLEFMQSGLMKVFVVVHEDKIIGGAFCAILQGKGIFTYYYCGQRDYNPRIFPTHLAVHAAIEYGINNGFIYLDFMGAGKAETEYGVRKYKLEFGGDLLAWGRYTYVLNPILFKFGKVGLAIIRGVKK